MELQRPAGRPDSVTAVGWLIVALSGAAAVGLLMTLADLSIWNPVVRNPRLHAGSVPFAVHVAVMVVGLLVQGASGLAILRRRNWGRYLYPGWSMAALLFSAATGTLVVWMVPGALVVAVLTVLLFRPRASA